MEASCQCGAVTFKTPLEKPLALYICHCTECRRQTSSAFGTSAIFPRFPLPDAELLSVYTDCGTRLIHTTPNKNVVSVKGGCLEGLDWNKAIHIWTKSAMIPIPEGAECYSEESEQTTGYSDSQETLDQPGMLAGSGGDPAGERKAAVEGLFTNVNPFVSMSGCFELLEVEPTGAGVTAAGLLAARAVPVAAAAAAGAVLVPIPRMDLHKRDNERGPKGVLQVEAAAEVELSNDDGDDNTDDDDTNDDDGTLDDTGTTDKLDPLPLPLAVVAAVVAKVTLGDPAAALFEQDNVTYTVCVTVSGRRLMICVGAAPCA
ncbi:hypothetical protein VP1G_05451 [Cytospora mali]|uniref:CENP-V/GFA domain-containing protein n=1 Tax=Cytospora mali TaxID=578113 RepID=A0A194V2T5_CYTMA|nr:hypothetical protein VP1G_05451 [Valsa mali var. pyri (nom. inval.)]